MNAITPSPFRMTDRAAARILELAGDTGQALRLSVEAGGCSGFNYKYELEANAAEDDLVISHGGARLLVDPASLDVLKGSELDYIDELMSARFAVRNPNATAGCGCGSSFAL